MNQTVSSIDIAIGKSVAAAFTSYGIQVRKPYSFSHSPEDVSSLLSLLTSFPSPSALITTDQEEVIDILMQNRSKLEFQLLNRK
ncbi:hypothetical protein ACFP56_10940 [Paenibacillus septentrionalis]|uniref:Uncharacterized protein n=1 Tax=Paenibacillus septentrionalis TaxID=429342 RepID=A0ABW1V6Y0_9BACL